jgi:hypothetical protein
VPIAPIIGGTGLASHPTRASHGQLVEPLAAERLSEPRASAKIAACSLAT